MTERSHKGSGIRSRAEQRAEAARVDAELYARAMAGERHAALARELGVSVSRIGDRVRRERERLQEAAWARR